jgi:hypothetical protein
MYGRVVGMGPHCHIQSETDIKRRRRREEARKDKKIDTESQKEKCMLMQRGRQSDPGENTE